MRRAIGIDIGGTHIKLALVDAHGCILAFQSLPTSVESGFLLALDRITNAITTVLHQTNTPIAEISGIGIGCTGPVDPKTGIIHNQFTLPGWENHVLTTPLHERFERPVFLENDAAVALLGEYRFGAGISSDPVMMLTIGTGVGGAALRNGQLWRGHANAHPEIGHIIVAMNGPPCYCGANGCLESLASGSAILQAAHTCGWNSIADLLAARKEGHPHAAAIVDRAAKAVATAVWTLAHTFEPARMILGGGIMETMFDLFLQPIQDRLASSTLIQKDSSTLVVPAALGSRAGVLGAASLPLFQTPDPRPNTPQDCIQMPP